MCVPIHTIKFFLYHIQYWYYECAIFTGEYSGVRSVIMHYQNFAPDDCLFCWKSFIYEIGCLIRQVPFRAEI